MKQRTDVMKSLFFGMTICLLASTALAVTPSISGVSPNPVTGSNSSQAFFINGSNFVSGCTVTLRDLSAGQTFANRTIISQSSTQIQLSVNFTTAAHTWSAEVINPGPSSSGQYQFQVVAPSVTPSISSVSPNPVPGSNSAQSFFINGSNFVSGCTVTLRDLTAGQTFANRTIISQSSTQIQLSVTFTTAADTWSAEVINPGNASSGQYQFQVTAPVVTPSIGGVSPNPVTGSNSAQSFFINGSNFVSGCSVTLRDVSAGQTFANRTIVSQSSTQIQLSVTFTTAAHTWSAEVINPGGASSGQYQFQVTSPTVTPSISSVSPNPVPGSNSAQTFFINGNNFVSGCTVTLRDITAGQTFANRTISSQSSTQIQLSVNFTTAADTWTAEVINPGGASSGQFQFTVSAPTVTPSITSVSPNPVPGSNSAQSFFINGTNFVSGCSVTLRDITAGQTFANRTIVSQSSTQIQLSVNFTTAADTWTAEVINPGGASSGQFQFTVSAPTATPSISSVSPNPVPGSNSAQTFLINGTNFVSGCSVTLRDITAGQTFANRAIVSQTSTQIQLSVNFTTAADTWTAEVINPGGASSGQFQFTVSAPTVTPSITSVSPNPVPGSNSAQSFFINGTNFVSGCSVTLRDITAGQTFANRTIVSQSSTQIQLSVNFTTAADTWTAEVINPGGASSGQFQFTVSAPTATPSISSVSPNPVPGSNSAQTFLINGTNFVSGCSVTLRDITAGQTFANRAIVSQTSTQIQLSVNFTTAADTWTAEVINPGGISSGQYQFQVSSPTITPTISSVSPNPVPGSNSAQSFFINGTNFVSGCTVTLRDLTAGQTFANRTIVSQTSTQIQLSVNFTTAADTWTAEVVNPGGASSGQFQFHVSAPAVTPSITSVSPNPVPGSNLAQTFLINGTNFASGCSVTLRDLTAGQTFANRTIVSQTSTQIQLSVNFTTAADTWTAEVINPGGASSGQFQFLVSAPTITPSITSVSPNPVPGSNTAQTFLINGVNFASGCSVTLRDLTAGQTFANRTIVSQTSTQLQLSVNFTTAGDSWTAEVINPGGASSGQYPFQVSPPTVTPTIFGVSPNPVPGSNNAQPFFINGTNFASGCTVTLRDVTAGQTFANRTIVSQTSTQIQLSVNFTTAADSWTVEVINPGGASSGQYPFQVSPPAVTPTIFSISPNPVPGSNNTQTFFINGANFASGCSVTLRDLTAGQMFANRTIVSQTSTQIQLSVNFTTAADTWTVEIINPGGASSGQYQFQVTAPQTSCALLCSATVPASASVGESISFAGTTSPSNCGTSAPTYVWSFGDGGSSGLASVTHSYLAPGTYAWSLTTTVNDQTCTRNGVISVPSICTLTCSADVPTSAVVGASVAFAAKISTPSCGDSPTYAWSFGDGATLTGANITHSYSSAGSFNWRLVIAEGATTCVRNGTISISSASSSLPVIDFFRGTRDQIAPGETSDLSWSVRSANSVTLEGFGTVPAVSATTVQPMQTTTYRLTAGNNSGPQSATFTVLVDPPLSLTARADRSTGTSPVDVTFAATAAGGIPPYRYVWSVGGEGSQAVHRFTVAGQYSITCTVTDAHGTSKKSAPVYVSVTSVANTLRLQRYDATESRPRNEVVAVAADGKARVEIHAVSEQPGTVTFEMVDSGGHPVPATQSTLVSDGGFITNGEGISGTVAKPLTQGNGGYEGSAIYHAPDDFNPVGVKSTATDRALWVKVTYKGTAGGNAISELLQLTLVRPPVVLIHGLWSSPSEAWATFSLPDRFRAYTVRWDGKSGLGQGLLQAFTGYEGGDNVTNVLTRARSEHEAVERVDVVGHSMGGLIGRALATEDYVHKIITIDTPHFGSAFANWLRDNPSLKAKLAGLLLSWKYSIDGGAVDDLRVGSADRQRLTSLAVSKAHAIVGVSSSAEPCPSFSSGETIVAAVCMATTFTPGQYNTCLKNFSTDILGEVNDEIVALSSQKGGLPENSALVTRFDGCVAVHTSITKYSAVATEVARLLDVSSDDASTFGTLNPPTQSQNDRLLRSESLVSRPTAGTPFTITVRPVSAAPLSNIVVHATGLPVDTLRLIVVGLDRIANSDAPPFDVTFTLPAAAIGTYPIQAIAVSATSYAESAPTEVFVTSEATVQTIIPEPSRLALPVGSKARLTVAAFFSDGVTRDITTLSTTTYGTSNTSVATVDTQGNVSAVSAGMAVLHIQNGQAQTDIQISVESGTRGRAVRH